MQPTLEAPCRGNALTTVAGVLLEPGERVIFFRRDFATGTRVALFFVGLLLLPVLIGVFVLYSVFANKAAATVVTSRRYIVIEDGKPVVMAHGQVRREERVMRVGKARGLEYIHVFDADGRRLSLNVYDDPVLRDLVNAIKDDPHAAERAPSVPFQP